MSLAFKRVRKQINRLSSDEKRWLLDAIKFDVDVDKRRGKTLGALRGQIQHAVDQLDRGEGIRGFDYQAFLAERHRSAADRPRL